MTACADIGPAMHGCRLALDEHCRVCAASPGAPCSPVAEPPPWETPEHFVEALTEAWGGKPSAHAAVRARDAQTAARLRAAIESADPFVAVRALLADLEAP
jgi:hypothetical protein